MPDCPDCGFVARADTDTVRNSTTGRLELVCGHCRSVVQ